MRSLSFFLAALGLSTGAFAQPETAPHNLYSTTRTRADLFTMRTLQACGINAVGEDSDLYEGLAVGFYVVLSGPFRSTAAAAEELARARACGINGQTRMLRRRPGNGLTGVVDAVHRARCSHVVEHFGAGDGADHILGDDAVDGGGEAKGAVSAVRPRDR